MRLNSICTPMVTLLMCALPFSAQANDITLELKATALAAENPQVIVNVHKDLERARLTLKSSKRSFNKVLGPKKSGQKLIFTLPHKAPGTLAWSGKLSVTFEDGASGEMPLNFKTERVTSFQFQVLSTQDEIRDKNEISISMQRPCSKVEVEVYGDNGALIASTAKEFGNAAPGTKLTTVWDPRLDTPPLHVRVKAFDDKGVFSTVDSFPYVIDVPHDEVEFESGKANVRKSEEHKLDKALAPVEKALVRYQKAVQLSGKKIRLFVLGHTDTVGGSAFNRGLSNKRALSIARWFRSHGIQTEIYARGFGEDRLKVDTLDNTDNAQNRRADYQVAVDSPTGSLKGWTRVR